MSAISLISSQRYLNEDIVVEKMLQEKRCIYISPPFLLKGKLVSVLLDGHHSLEASKRLGVNPTIEMADEEDGCEVELLYQDAVECFMNWNKNESEYYQTYIIKGDFEPVNKWC